MPFLCLGGAVAMVRVEAAEAPDRSDGREAYRRIRIQERATRDDLQRLWREVVRRQPPAQRERWLNTQEARSALGVRRCQDLLDALRAGYLEVELVVPGGAWLEAYFAEDVKMPADRMPLSRQLVRYGLEGKPHRRHTPRHARPLEDFIDGQDPSRALFYPHPPSPSALAIRHIAFYGRRDLKPIAGPHRAKRKMS